MLRDTYNVIVSPVTWNLMYSLYLSLSLPLSSSLPPFYFPSLSLSDITQSSRITHGTSPRNECDKHVSVTGPPAVGPVHRPGSESLMPPLPVRPNFNTDSHRNHIFFEGFFWISNLFACPKTNYERCILFDETEQNDFLMLDVLTQQRIDQGNYQGNHQSVINPFVKIVKIFERCHVRINQVLRKMQKFLFFPLSLFSIFYLLYLLSIIRDIYRI